MKIKDHYAVMMVALSSIYFVTARFGLSLNAVSGFATLVWIPTGISLAFLLVFGLKYWPGIFIGAFLANLFTGAPLLSALGIGLGNTSEALIGAYLLIKIVDFKNSLERLKDVLGLIIIAAIFSTLFSATVGVASLYSTGVISASSIFSTWTAWWIGDTISNLVVAPFILVWMSSKFRLKTSLKKLFEAFVAILFFSFIYLIIFANFLGLPAEKLHFVYLIFPPLTWIALRFGQRGAVLAILVFSSLATLSTLLGQGPFINASPSENLIALQIYMAIISITTMILASITSERERLSKVKDEFISIASHELKTPITTIKGYNQLLFEHLSKHPDKKAIYYSSKLNDLIGYLTRLIADFFDVSKIQAGKLDLQKEIFGMDELVKEAREDIQHLSNVHKIVLKGETKKQIFADRYRIRQVLINLLLNAIKFSPKANKINIFLSSSKREVKIEVQDYGIGISKKDLEKVFERFFQANTNIRQSVSGIGLGLYICSEIIKQHGGKIWANSIKGKGSTFSFNIPLET